MSKRLAAVAVAVAFASASVSCKPVAKMGAAGGSGGGKDKGKTGASADAVDAAADAATPGIADGTSYFTVAGGRLMRYRCTAEQIAKVPAAATLDDAVTLETFCTAAPPAEGAPAVESFSAALAEAYLNLVDDQDLNELERFVLQRYLDGFAPGAAPPQPIDRAMRPAAAAIEARFSGLFDDAYDSKPAPRGGPAATEGAPPAAAGLGLADTVSEYVVGTGKFTTTFTEGRTVGLSLPVKSDAPAVDTLYASTRREGSTSACGAQVIGLAKATASTGSSVPMSLHPSKPNAFQLNGGKPVKLASVLVAVRRGANTYGQSCILDLRGQVTTHSGYQAPALMARDRKMKALMGQRSHRLWHFLWHGVRNAWPALSSKQKKELRDTLGSAWARKDTETLSRPDPYRGEEFLHMHRGMLTMLKSALGSDMYEAWPAPPAPSSKTFPVPAGNTPESDADYRDRILPWHQQMEPGRLRQVSLAAFGLWLEAGLHNSLHSRFADPAKRDFERMRDLFQKPLAAWDAPESDYLGSTYSSHVNPIFYHLHGYVDARIEDWRRANGYDVIADDCAGRAKCYQWQGVWDGPTPHAGLGLLEGEAHVDGGGDGFERLPKPLRRLIRESSHMFPVAGEALDL